MTIFKEITRLPEFEKDFRKLVKKFRTLEEDLQVLIHAELGLYHKIKQNNGGIVQIPGLHILEPKIYKARKFACRSLKGKGAHSGLRLIYAYFEQDDRIELIEIYYKGDQKNEDKERIIRHYK